MSAYDRLVARFNGAQPSISCWSPTEYRVAYFDWHVHNGACSGAPFADGISLESACSSLLRQVNAPAAELVEGRCDLSCERRYSTGPKTEIAGCELMKFIRGVGAEADKWPAWKRGLPPCPNPACDRAAGHKCRHGKARR